MALSPDQLQAIDRHLRKDNWLLNEDLIRELTDHYVAGVEDWVAQGLSFETGMVAVHHDFGGRKGLLRMEEEYQVQKQRAIGRLEWQTIRSFVEGPRWPVTVCMFGLLYYLNVYMGYSEMTSSGLLTGQFYVAVSVLTSVCMSLWYVYVHRKEINSAVKQPTSAVYLTLYCFSLALLLLNKYGLVRYGIVIPVTGLALVETTLETLCIVYYIAILITIKELFKSNWLKKA